MGAFERQDGTTAPEGRALPGRCRIERFDPEVEGADEALAELWTREGALSPERARARVADARFVAIDREDGVVGVATAQLTQNRHLGLPLWSYRTYVAAPHREGDIAFLLLHATRDHLAELFASGRDARAAGMIMEVQNDILKRARNQGVWSTTRFAFIGEDEVGAHHRVCYFPGAVVPVPDERGALRPRASGARMEGSSGP